MLFSLVEKQAFEIQLTSITGFFIILLNISMIIVYCKFAGMAYKSPQHFQNVRQCFYVSAYWSLAFILKFITTFIKGISPDNIGALNEEGNPGSESNQLSYVIIYFSLCVICDILPFLIVIDAQFIKIFTFDLIRKFTQDEKENQDIENDFAMQGQEEKILQIRHQQMNHSDFQEEFKIMYSSKYEKETVESNQNYNPMKFMLNYLDTQSNFSSKDEDVIAFEELKLEDEKLFKVQLPFERTWYRVDNKSSKQKLGRLYHATFKFHQKDKEKQCLCRLIDMERISPYTIENFNNRMKKIT